MTNIEPNWTDRRCVTQSQTDRVGVVSAEVLEAHWAKNVTTIIEGREAQSFLDWQRNAQFGVQNKELTASGRYANESACRRVRRIAAGWNCLLRACTV